MHVFCLFLARLGILAIIVSLIMSLAIGGVAQASDIEGRGRILNADGGWCWYTQTVEKKKAAFLGPLQAKIATMTFDKPGCMAETTEDGLDFAADFNRKNIADRIAGLVRGSWVIADAVYDPSSRNQPGMLQKSGECLVADELQAAAIAINFVSNGASITTVEYAQVFGCGGPAVAGCTRCKRCNIGHNVH